MNPLASIPVLAGAAAIIAYLVLTKDEAQAVKPPPKMSPELAARVRAQLVQEERVNNVRVKTVWKMDGFGTVMVATFKFHNGNDVAVKDIEVKCDQYGQSGTLISTATRTVYRSLPPKKETTVPDFNMGFVHTQSATAGCKVTNVG